MAHGDCTASCRYRDYVLNKCMVSRHNHGMEYVGPIRIETDAQLHAHTNTLIFYQLILNHYMLTQSLRKQCVIAHDYCIRAPVQEQRA